ncbi:MAG: hypothetical protein HZB31_11240 [Nitrospirae bacterium]|nr:hypothetical protein [Nitrospirota bacterium]
MLTIDCKGAVEKMFTKTSSDATLNGFHIRVVVSVGIAWATLSLGIMLAGFVVPLAFTQGITNLSLSVYMIAGLGSLYIGMPLSTKFATLVGEKNTILIGLGIVGLASIISIIFDDFWTLTIVRFLGGFRLAREGHVWFRSFLASGIFSWMCRGNWNIVPWRQQFCASVFHVWTTCVNIFGNSCYFAIHSRKICKAVSNIGGSYS